MASAASLATVALPATVVASALPATVAAFALQATVSASALPATAVGARVEAATQVTAAPGQETAEALLMPAAQLMVPPAGISDTAIWVIGYHGWVSDQVLLSPRPQHHGTWEELGTHQLSRWQPEFGNWQPEILTHRQAAPACLSYTKLAGLPRDWLRQRAVEAVGQHSRCHRNPQLWGPPAKDCCQP